MLTPRCTPPSEAIEAERASAESFSAQPFYFMEVACLLLEQAKEAFPEGQYLQVRCALRESDGWVCWLLRRALLLRAPRCWSSSS